MRRELHSVIVVILVTTFLAMVPFSNVALVHAANSNVSVNPTSTSVNIGDTFTVNINLDSAANLWGFQFDLHFDQTKLQATAIDDGGYLNTPTTVFANTIDNTNGVVSYAVSSHLPAVAKTGGSPPPLATIHFTAIASGSSSLHLANTILVDSNTFTIPSTTSDGQVTIAGGVQPTPTPYVQYPPSSVGGTWKPITDIVRANPMLSLAGLIGAIAISGIILGLFMRRLKKQIS